MIELCVYGILNLQIKALKEMEILDHNHNANDK